MQAPGMNLPYNRAKPQRVALRPQSAPLRAVNQRGLSASAKDKLKAARGRSAKLPGLQQVGPALAPPEALTEAGQAPGLLGAARATPLRRPWQLTGVTRAAEDLDSTSPVAA